MILQHARESIAQARITSAVGSQCPVLSFNIAGAYVLRVWVTAHVLGGASNALCRRIARLILQRSTIDLMKLGEIYFGTEGILGGSLAVLNAWWDRRERPSGGLHGAPLT